MAARAPCTCCWRPRARRGPAALNPLLHRLDGVGVDQLAEHRGCKASLGEPEPDHEIAALAHPIELTDGKAQAAALLTHPGRDNQRARLLELGGDSRFQCANATT